jgi:hypothetical protein
MARETQDIELKEHVDRKRFLGLLNEFLKASEGNSNFSLEVKGRQCGVPASAFANANFRVEYEIDEGEHELEFTMKWQ